MTDEYPPPGSDAIGAPPRLRHRPARRAPAAGIGERPARATGRFLGNRGFVAAGLLGLVGVAALVRVLTWAARRPTPDGTSALFTIAGRLRR
ncbi:MAG TPA: hypothetical protein VGG41_01105 [Solirubrobacteraceae bacterium]|jgi:hypothetical protein